MAVQTTQIFGKSAVWAWTVVPMATANTTKDGTSGTTYYLKDNGGSDYVVGADGAMAFDFVFRPLGTNSNDTVARIFLNNGSTDATAANNILLHEVTLLATINSEISSQTPVTFGMNKVMKSGQKFFITVGTAPTSAGWKAWMSGMDYTA